MEEKQAQYTLPTGEEMTKRVSVSDQQGGQIACVECGQLRPAEDLKGIWPGMCKDCEQGRINDVCAG